MKRQFFALVFLILAGLTLAQEGPLSRGPYFAPRDKVTWARGILLPPLRSLIEYCYDPDILYILQTKGPEEIYVQAYMAHRVAWGEGNNSVAFYTAMGATINLCAKYGPDEAFTRLPHGMPASLFVYGTVKSMDEINRWRAQMVLRDSRGRALVRLDPHQSFPSFKAKSGLYEGNVIYAFYPTTGIVIQKPGSMLDLSEVVDRVYAIELRVSRGSKEAVYLIRYVDYPDLW